MIVLHAGYRNGNFLLWGEATPDVESGPSTRRGRKPKKPGPRPFPYDAGTVSLESALRGATVGFKKGKERATQTVVWLPTRSDLPIPSSALIAEPRVSKAKTVLAPWMVSALALSMDQSIELLCTCMGKEMLAPGLVVGSDLSFWTDVLRFAGALVARQQYLPGLKIEENKYRACWEPIFAGSDAERLAGLAKRIPPAARALCDTGEDSPAAISPSVTLERLLSSLVGNLVSTSLRGEIPSTGGPRKRKPSFDSLHDAWLHALRSPDAVIKGDDTELARFATQVQEWRRPIDVSATSPFRLCFRLEEPNEIEHLVGKRKKSSAEDWYVRYLLQPHDDRSLLVPIEDIWAAGRRKTSVAGRFGSNAREYLLSVLGQATGICPHIANSLEAARPAGYILDTAGAHDFLISHAIALEQAGFGVMLPAWWTRKGTKVRPAVKAIVKTPKMQGGGGLSLDQIVKFDWEVALGDEQMTLRELEALASLKTPLIQLRGQWVELNPAEIAAAIEFWKQKSSQPVSVRDLIQIALGSKETPGGFEFDGVKAAGWIKKLLDQLNGRVPFKTLPAPHPFSGELRPYQLRGYSWLSYLSQWGLGACLADDMGLGKTIQTLALIQRDWHSNGKRPVLLICPTSVVNNWRKEASRFTPELPILVHHGLARRRGVEFKQEKV